MDGNAIFFTERSVIHIIAHIRGRIYHQQTTIQKWSMEMHIDYIESELELPKLKHYRISGLRLTDRACKLLRICLL